jgi:hypothetical protein
MHNQIQFCAKQLDGLAQPACAGYRVPFHEIREMTK